jgi:hypothetical protein
VNSERIKLLYIASTGRAGSTILEMLLNAHPMVWTLGEFDILPWEILTNLKPCGCGTPIEQCPFWMPIIAENRATILNGEINRFRRTHNTDRAIRFREVPYVFGRMAVDRRRSAAIASYADANEEVLSKVLAAASEASLQPISWLVDASKSPYRLMWLASSGRFDLRVIHLMKDPRAFVYSMAKSLHGVTRSYRALRSALRWQAQNRLFDSVVQRYVKPEHAMRLRYEELASDVESTMSGIYKWLEIPFEPGAALHFRDGNHGVAGNPARGESKPIRLDDKWRRDLPAALANLSFLLNRRLAQKYGYAW